MIYTELQGLLGVQTEENQMEESVVMVTHHDKGSVSSVGVPLEQTMRTKEGTATALCKCERVHPNSKHRNQSTLIVHCI